MTENETTAQQKKSKKKKMLIAILVVTVLGAASWVLTEMPHLFTGGGKIDPLQGGQESGYYFYPVDYDLDVTADAVYMDLNRHIYLKTGAETIAITNGNYARYGNTAVFFGAYFEAIVAGDTETYNSFFTDNYYKTHKPYEDFPPQMVYDILVEQLSLTENEDRTITYTFNVSYKLHRNTGTFRNDIGSDASRVLYFELVEAVDGTVLIDRIAYYN